jgi:nucleoid DNA-binding protein/cell division septation protein DedD
LLENETVIIPGFGAFLSTYKPAEIRENEIIPPSKEISFTQKIKNNDGMLAEVIARKAKISQSYAMKRIEKARENMLYELDKGETVIVENIGSLVYNEKNEIQFTAFQNENLLLDSFGFEAIPLKDADVKPADPGIVEIPVSVGDVVHSENEIETDEVAPPETFDLPKFIPAAENKKPEKKKRTVWYWYLLILIPIVVGGYLVVNKDSRKGEPQTDVKQNVAEEKQNVEAAQPTQVDSAQEIEPENSKKDSTTTKVAPVLTGGDSKFHVIGGSFKDEENSEKYILKLKEKGINGFVLGKKGSLYLVGIESFDNEADAQELLNELVKANPGWNLWIYEK